MQLRVVKCNIAWAWRRARILACEWGYKLSPLAGQLFEQAKAPFRHLKPFALEGNQAFLAFPLSKGIRSSRLPPAAAAPRT